MYILFGHTVSEHVTTKVYVFEVLECRTGKKGTGLQKLSHACNYLTTACMCYIYIKVVLKCS